LVKEGLTGRPLYGKYRGTVTQVDATNMRIKAKVNALKNLESGWAQPCVPYAGRSVGFAFLPEKDAAVWIEFEQGDVSHPIWTGGFWLQKEVPSDVKPGVKVIATKKHKVLLDDDHDTITIQDSNGNSVKLDSNGITLERGSRTVQVSSGQVSVNGNSLTVT
jgi:uncharacterized protein involved in type VI secretion and phage assembly